MSPENGSKENWAENMPLAILKVKMTATYINIVKMISLLLSVLVISFVGAFVNLKARKVIPSIRSDICPKSSSPLSFLSFEQIY